MGKNCNLWRYYILQGNEKLMDIQKVCIKLMLLIFARSETHVSFPQNKPKENNRDYIYSFSKDINNNALLLLMSFGSLGDDLCNMKLGQEIWPNLM